MTIAKDGQGSKEAEFVMVSPGKRPFGVPRDMLVVGALVAASAASFGLGSAFSSAPPPVGDTQAATVIDSGSSPSIESAVSAPHTSSAAKAPPKVVGHASGTYVASKNGTKYYLPTCATANRIKDENKIWFISKEEAEAAGYGPSSTCKGL